MSKILIDMVAKLINEVLVAMESSLSSNQQERLRSILQQGLDEGTFDIDNASVVAVTIHYALRGLDLPNIRGQFTALGVPTNRLRQSIFNMIFYGILTHAAVAHNHAEQTDENS